MGEIGTFLFSVIFTRTLVVTSGAELTSALPNSAFSASSSVDTEACKAYQSRFAPENDNTWCAATDADQYLQVDLERPAVISGVSSRPPNLVQGDGYLSTYKWVTEYTVSFSEDTVSYKKLKDSDGSDRVFKTRSEHRYIRNDFEAPFLTTRIRIHVMKNINTAHHPAGRFAVYGCVASTINKTCGATPDLADGLPPERFTASSHDAACPPADSRMSSGNGWCPKDKLDTGEHVYLQINFGESVKITGIKAAKRLNKPNWIHMYQISYDVGGGEFKFLLGADGDPMMFEGPGRQPDVQYFKSNIIARRIRFNPTAWYGQVRAQFGIYGCYDQPEENSFQFGFSSLGEAGRKVGIPARKSSVFLGLQGCGGAVVTIGSCSAEDITVHVNVDRGKYFVKHSVEEKGYGVVEGDEICRAEGLMKFWISWSGNKIRLGHGTDVLLHELISREISSLKNFRRESYISISAEGSKGVTWAADFYPLSIEGLVWQKVDDATIWQKVPLTLGQERGISFHLQSSHKVSINLQAGNSAVMDGYPVLEMNEGNTTCSIRDGFSEADILATKAFCGSNVTGCARFIRNVYWVSWSEGTLQLGTGRDIGKSVLVSRNLGRDLAGIQEIWVRGLKAYSLFYMPLSTISNMPAVTDADLAVVADRNNSTCATLRAGYRVYEHFGVALNAIKSNRVKVILFGRNFGCTEKSDTAYYIRPHWMKHGAELRSREYRSCVLKSIIESVAAPQQSCAFDCFCATRGVCEYLSMFVLKTRNTQCGTQETGFMLCEVEVTSG